MPINNIEKLLATSAFLLQLEKKEHLQPHEIVSLHNGRLTLVSKGSHTHSRQEEQAISSLFLTAIMTLHSIIENDKKNSSFAKAPSSILPKTTDLPVSSTKRNTASSLMPDPALLKTAKDLEQLLGAPPEKILTKMVHIIQTSNFISEEIKRCFQFMLDPDSQKLLIFPQTASDTEQIIHDTFKSTPLPVQENAKNKKSSHHALNAQIDEYGEFNIHFTGKSSPSFVQQFLQDLFNKKTKNKKQLQKINLQIENMKKEELEELLNQIITCGNLKVVIIQTNKNIPLTSKMTHQIEKLLQLNPDLDLRFLSS